MSSYAIDFCGCIVKKVLSNSQHPCRLAYQVYDTPIKHLQRMKIAHTVDSFACFSIIKQVYNVKFCRGLRKTTIRVNSFFFLDAARCNSFSGMQMKSYIQLPPSSGMRKSNPVDVEKRQFVTSNSYNGTAPSHKDRWHCLN